MDYKTNLRIELEYFFIRYYRDSFIPCIESKGYIIGNYPHFRCDFEIKKTPRRKGYKLIIPNAIIWTKLEENERKDFAKWLKLEMRRKIVEIIKTKINFSSDYIE